MQLQFISVELHNFASYADSTLELDDLGVTLVNGRNFCHLDNAYSNGSGKSALFNAICFAITGETCQGISSGIENIFTNPDDCWVRLTMRVDGDEVVLQRIKTPKQNLKIYINGEDVSGKGIRESSQVLSTYIPDLTSELLSSIIILGQGLPHRFTNNKPSHRKELLEDLTKSDFMIQSIKDKLEARSNELKLQIRSNEDLKISLSSKNKVYKDQLTQYQNEYDEYEKMDVSEQAHRGLVDMLSHISVEIDSESKIIDEADAEIQDINKWLSELPELNRRDLEICIGGLEASKKEMDAELVNLNADIRSLTSEIRTLENIKDVCPTCGQKIPGAVKPDTTAKHAELDSLTEKYNQVKSERDKKEAEIQGHRDSFSRDYQNERSKSLDKLNLATTKKQEASTKKSGLYTKQVEVTEKLTKLDNLKANFEKLKQDIDSLKTTIQSTEQEEQRVSLEITELNSHVDIVQQMTTLAKREFRGILLLNVINLIDKKAKQYSREVFGTDKLSFTLNDNYIDITYCDKLYENLSGGEKQKIDIIIQLALRDILSRQLNIHSNLLVLDEIYDNADATSCQAITNLISTLTDINSIFIISHHTQDLGITYDTTLLVEKGDDGVSQIRFV